ncbi:MAG: contractile injection system protein, VgrG/Pvc8 family [Chitinophagaceae bacterium]
MQPIYALFINGIDVTTRLQGRVMSITLDDSAGFSNDKLTIVVENDPPIVVPKRGAKLSFFLGYQSKENMPVPRDRMLKYMGDFELDETDVGKSKDGGKYMRLNLHGLATGSLWKETYNKEYEGVSIGEIVEYVARQNKLEAIIDPKFYKVTVEYIAQTKESYQSFLTRLAMRYGAGFKISSDKLLFTRIGSIETLAAEIAEHETESWSWLNQSTSNYGTVVTNAYNPDLKRYEYAATIVKTNSAEESEREENARLELPSLYATKEEAQAAADGKASALEAQGHTLSITLSQGRPALRAEMMIKTRNFHPTVQGVKFPQYWHLAKVVHSFSKDGYKTTIECDKPFDAERAEANSNLTSEQQQALIDARAQTVKDLKKEADKERKERNDEKKRLLKQQ